MVTYGINYCSALCIHIRVPSIGFHNLQNDGGVKEIKSTNLVKAQLCVEP